MKLNYYLVLGAVSVCSAQAVACSSAFDSCEARRACGGDGAGENSPTEAGSGGAAGERSGGDASLGGDSAGGGSAGALDNEPAAGAGGESGEGGAAGAADSGPTLFGACAVEGEVACVGHASDQRLACDGGKWQVGSTCAAGTLCDSSTGACAKPVAECMLATSGEVVCRGDQLLTCGPDLVTASEGSTCAGLCKDGACQEPVCGDEKLEPGEDCDDALATKSGACVKCKLATCGDGVVYVGHEQCDDGNRVAGDGCSPTCTAEPIALALGVASTCVLSSTGVVKCWGDNAHGALGLGDVVNRGDAPSRVPSKLPAVSLGAGRTAIAISAGRDDTCALLDNGDVKCWGVNAVGQLGTGDLNDRGDGPGEMGDALKPIALGAGRTATAVKITGDHACAVLDNGDLKCWGSGASGLLGQENIINYSRVDQLAPVKLGRAATAVSVSDEEATCALLDNGTGKCWGDITAISVPSTADLGGPGGVLGAVGDFSGEISGLPPLTFGAGRTAKAIASGGRESCAILSDDALKCWGAGSDGQLGQPHLFSAGTTPEQLVALPVINLGTGRQAKSVDLNVDHVCAVLDNGTLKCWGYGGSGQLGLGSTDSKGLNDGDMGDALPPVYLGGRLAHQVATGGNHTCAILDDGTVKCWGYNGEGELGLGDTRARGDSGGELAPDTTVDLSF